MKVTVAGRHMDVGQALRDHVELGLETVVAKYFDKAIEASVTFAKNGTFFDADISVHVGRGILVQGGDQADDPYLAFNSASDHIGKRLRRYKRRLRDHHQTRARQLEAQQAQQYILAQDMGDGAGAAGDNPEEPIVIAEMTMDIESLTVGDAVMRLDLADAPAMMFRNAAHGGLNMIYRRPDGNIGWVDPRGTRERTK